MPQLLPLSEEEEKEGKNRGGLVTIRKKRLNAPEQESGKMLLVGKYL